MSTNLISEGVGSGPGEREDDASVVIDCDLCEMQGTEVCADCVVTYLCRTETTAVVIDLAEIRALRTLGAGGLVPELRHRPAVR